jgi:methylase of polypeptide subunit release factors
MLSTRDTALVELGNVLRALDYTFVTVTPETHQRVLTRDAWPARSLRDVFGWSRPFAPEVVPERVLALLTQAHAIEQCGGLLRARVRYATLLDRIFVHSAFPTTARDSVFFGPDTYRFCSFIRRNLGRCCSVVDVGCGSGAGGIVAASLAQRVVLADIQPHALRFAAVNAALAGVPAELVESDVLGSVEGPFDCVIANPPYLRDPAGRLYRDGGGNFGEALSLRIAGEALNRLEAGGKLLLYTGAPNVGGVDVLRRGLEELCARAGANFTYEELDPDVFGNELDAPSYADVERIAAVGLVATLA